MTTAAEATKDILRGYGEADQAALASLVEVQDWQRIARQEDALCDVAFFGADMWCSHDDFLLSDKLILKILNI